QPRFLLLDAIAVAGGIPETAERLYVIRQVPLEEEVLRGWGEPAPADGASPRDERPAEPESIEDVIDELLGGEGGASPGVLSGQPAEGPTGQAADQSEPVLDVPAPAPDVLGEGRWIFLNGQWMRVAAPTPQPGVPPTETEP